MKNKNLILIAGAAAVAAYFLLKGKGKSFIPMDSAAPGPVDKDQTDAVINADKQKISVSDAIDAVAAVSDKIKDLKVDIIKGGEKTTVRTGKKQKSGAGRKRTKRTKRTKPTKKQAQAAAKVAASVATQAAMQAAGLPPFVRSLQTPFPFYK